MSSTEVGTRGAATVIADTKTIAEATPDTRDGLMGTPTATTITHPDGDSKTCVFRNGVSVPIKSEISTLTASQISRKDGERGRDDKVVMAASRLQTEPASRSRLEDELSKLPAQKIAAGRLLSNSRIAAPHGGAEPLDQPRLADDQAVSLRRAGERAIAADQADADVRRCFRQQFRSGVAEAALIEDEEVEAGEVRCDQGELLAQGACGRRSAAVTVSRSGSTSRSTRALWSLGGRDRGRQLAQRGRHVTPRSLRSEKGGDNFAGLRVPRRSYPLVRLRCWPGGSACGAQGLLIFLPPSCDAAPKIGRGYK